MRRLWLLLVLACLPAVLIVLGVASFIIDGVREGGNLPSGTLTGLGVEAPVRIDRDERGIPHVRAANEHDLFFAEGYVQGTDRLFQLDLYRRLVSGRLGEIFGSLAIQNDVAVRVYDINGIVNRESRRLSPRGRVDLEAFAAGVNAAMRTRPLPPEFRVLGYQPEPWAPRDSLLVSFATVVALTDDWQHVATREAVVRKVGPAARDAFFPVTDPAYESPVGGGRPAPVASLPPLTVPYPTASPLYGVVVNSRTGLGSNEFVAGAERTTTRRALLGNDPHLQLRMPGIWYLADLEAPGIHVAGATLAGVPGIVLGHNEHLAWGATNGSVATVRVYRERFSSGTSDRYLAGGRWIEAQHRSERFRVRFGRDLIRDYLRTRHGFLFEDDGVVRLAAAWTADLDPRPPGESFDALDRAASVADGFKALSTYAGPPQNFVLADDRGQSGYTLAGQIPRDTHWGLSFADGPTSPPPTLDAISFGELPHVAPGRTVLASTANNRIYGAGYPYRLSAAFEPPYRAAEIARDLAHVPYDVAAFSAIQADLTSLPERELAHATAAALGRSRTRGEAGLAALRAALAGFDGRFTGDSTAAVDASALRQAVIERLVRLHMAPDVGRRYLSENGPQALVAVLRMLRERPHGWVPGDDYDAFLVAAARDVVARLTASGRLGKPWSAIGGRVATHPLNALGVWFWNGTPFPGLGDAYSPHVQGPSVMQSFRAVWDVGNWEAGGIVIPQGESGEPGSRFYRDEAPIWLRGTLVPLPFSDAAVARSRIFTLELDP
ncbi:MAG: penicillin acylase family protein [Vulcanimicrobiaceae bacterium]